MAKNIEDLRAMITELDTKIDEDLAQTAEIIVAVNTLLEKVAAIGNPDLQAEVDAVAALITKLTSDNPSVQAAIDASKTA